MVFIHTGLFFKENFNRNGGYVKPEEMDINGYGTVNVLDFIKLKQILPD